MRSDWQPVQQFSERFLQAWLKQRETDVFDHFFSDLRARCFERMDNYRIELQFEKGQPQALTD